MSHSIAESVLQDFLEKRLTTEVADSGSGLPDALLGSLTALTDLVPYESVALYVEWPRTGEAKRRIGCVAALGGDAEELLGTFQEPSDNVVWEAIESERPARRPGGGGSDHQLHAVALPLRVGADVWGACRVTSALRLSVRHLAILDVAIEGISSRLGHAVDNLRALEIYQRDGLTGLFNDRSLHQSMSELIRDCRRDRKDLAILFLDLDFFKRVNDTHGHLAGSQVLREVGDLLNRAAEPMDAVAARYGGDEFVIAARGLDVDRAIALAETIRLDVLAATFCERPSDLQPEALGLTGITCSVGIATLRVHGASESDVERCKSRLLRLSDSAMYVAKETGRNRTAVAGTVVEADGASSLPAPEPGALDPD